MRKLHGHPLSGNTHKVRMLLGFLKVSYEEVLVDVMTGQHKEPEFLAMNPLGQIPVFTDGDVTLRDAQAILVYVARRYGGDAWLPSDPAQMGAIVQWLSFAANEIRQGPFMARVHFLFNANLDLPKINAAAHAAFKTLNDRLSQRAWLELGRPTIADIACFPDTGLAPEGQLSLNDYPHLLAWMSRIKALPGYPSMRGLE